MRISDGCPVPARLQKRIAAQNEFIVSPIETKRKPAAVGKIPRLRRVRRIHGSPCGKRIALRCVLSVYLRKPRTARIVAKFRKCGMKTAHKPRRSLKKRRRVAIQYKKEIQLLP